MRQLTSATFLAQPHVRPPRACPDCHTQEFDGLCPECFSDRAEACEELQYEHRTAQHDLAAAEQCGDPDRIRRAARDLKAAAHELTQHLARPT